jgi:hypothetical protein
MKTMRTLSLVAFAVMASVGVVAQAPQLFSYQAVVRDAGNTLVAQATVGMQISILQGSPNGPAVYVETHAPTTNANGLASVAVGGGTVVSGSMVAIDWSAGPYFIKTETDPAGGTAYSIVGTTQLLSVPYALYASNAGGSGSFSHYIGEEFGGGVIFYLWKDAQAVEHGLIVDIIDLSAGQAWSNVTSTIIGPAAQSNWDGINNNNAIVAQPGHTSSAAALCLNSTNNGQNDWYLPSILELHSLWNNYYSVCRGFSQIPGATELDATLYWSSTEKNTGFTWYFDFDNEDGDANGSISKSNTYRVRAIRSF